VSLRLSALVLKIILVENLFKKLEDYSKKLRAFLPKKSFDPSGGPIP